MSAKGGKEVGEKGSIGRHDGSKTNGGLEEGERVADGRCFCVLYGGDFGSSVENRISSC